MNDINRSLSVVAFFLSEYNDKALSVLGYRTYTEAFREISRLFGKDNNYMKLRRDEFDALPESRSIRLGWRNRAPKREVLEMASLLRKLDFYELSDIVIELVHNAAAPYYESTLATNEVIVNPDKVESIINAEDKTAQVMIRTGNKKIRVYNTKIIIQLKRLYSYRCQICGQYIGEPYNSNLIHAHHIDYFSQSLNNNASNILIVCPNHHGIIHDRNPVFDNDNLLYNYPNGYKEGLKINLHL